MANDTIHRLRRQLADEVLESVSHLNVNIAAMVLELDSARMADLRHDRCDRFSVERLIRMLALVDRSVSVTVHGKDTRVSFFRIARERFRERQRHPAPPTKRAVRADVMPGATPGNPRG